MARIAQERNSIFIERINTRYSTVSVPTTLFLILGFLSCQFLLSCANCGS